METIRSTGSRRLGRAVGGFALIVSLLPFIHPARGDLGDLLQTVEVPPAARCVLGTSVALVPGSMINRPNIPVLLVISCFDSSDLFFLDPSTTPATLIHTITTNPTPPQGWGALSLRGDKADLLGCGNNSDTTHAIYSIDISPFNSTADGTATFMFNAEPGLAICDGVAWDASEDTIFQSPDVDVMIYRFSETGTSLGSFPLPLGCPNSGLAVGGASLFAACNGVLRIHQLDKISGMDFAAFPTAGTRTEDLECDPISFAAMNVDAMWSKDAFDNEIFAFEIPDNTCGFAGGPPVVPGACPDGSTDDADGDSLLDCWENDGIDFDGDGTIDLELYDVDQDGTIQASERADPDHKDIYLEIDWMAQHQPNMVAVNMVTNSFANAPVANPDGTTGIRLHIQTNEQTVAHNNNFAFEPCTAAPPGGTPDFDDTKSAWFGTAAERAGANSVNVLNSKRLAFHYSLYVHNLLGLGGTSGCAELPGNDFVVSLGSGASVGGHGVGNVDQQAGTLMHEFGHNLNLRHGGVDNHNCKPNYLSVLNYTRQFNNTPVMGRPLDFSRSALATLNEINLSEPAGIGGPAGQRTAYGPGAVRVAAANSAIDWNRDGDTTDTGVGANVNFIPASNCGGSSASLLGHDDWGNLQYDFRNTVDYADGVHLSLLEADEITTDEATALSPDTDGDGVKDFVDNCPSIANANQQDSDMDGIGDACAEAFWNFSGVAQGGTIRFTIQGVALVVTTEAGDTAAEVAAAISAVINGDPTLAADGIHSAATDTMVVTTAVVTSGEITDPGIQHSSDGGAECLDGPTTLCLNSERFRVEVEWRDFQGQTGTARVVPFGSDDSGLLWFFQADNWEMLIKVLDGCGINNRFWVFAAATTDVEYTLRVTDTLAGLTKTYLNPLGNAAPALTDTDAFGTCQGAVAGAGGAQPDVIQLDAVDASSSRFVTSEETIVGGSAKEDCLPGENNLCLNQGRFRIEVEWQDFGGGTGSGRVVPFGSDDSGLLWFFQADNWEMLIKVLDGCAINDHFWVFAAATTNVQYTLRVTDTDTGIVKEYLNPLGNSASAITDTVAFSTCMR